MYSTIPEYSLFQDSHDKAVQIHSLLRNGFHSEELFYPGKRIDSNLEFYYLPKNLHLVYMGKVISAFPVSFAIIASPFYWLIGIKNLPYFSLIFSIITLILLRKYWKFDFLFLSISFFCTFAWPLSFDFSENTLIILLSLIPLILLFKGAQNLRKHFIAGIFLGFYIWFRLEGLIFAGSLLFFYAMGILSSNFRKRISKKAFMFLNILLGLFMTTSIFFLWNWIDYGNILGTRYLANLQGFSVLWSQRLNWAISLLFFGPLKVGYFGYLPSALILFSILTFHIRKLSKTNRALLGSSLLFLFLVLLTTPNDGFNNWGPRFFASIILPYIILIRKFWFLIKRKGKKALKFILFFCFVYSFILGLVGLGFQRARSIHVKKFSSIISSVNADIWVYTDYLSFYSIGTHYLDKIVFRADSSKQIIDIVNRSSKVWPNRKIAFVQYDLSIVDVKIRKELEKNSMGVEIVHPVQWDQKIIVPILKDALNDFRIFKVGGYEIWTGILK
ncbi:hypothetical protein EHO98_14715 [Leptospira stimsonii]|uniref:Glycosyltransferase RgtA/B/C/D-like domain-containing protein n=1 Tax=Leptospira stimsonii TaxID=2202203 RepID=A0ABY2MUF8_9LEPT|nr:hypothetical protein [Leptospira stimsonii]TGK15446.1 hypothetical protein EHO98_14715 [Leptospira stimsonii]TGM08310.1 hypothetical protein EHQ90_22680 [Leptospira stimsonii]